MTDPEMKPCPFCGSAQVGLVPSLMAADYVECHKCWSHGPIMHMCIKHKPTNRGMAIEAWNKRPGLKSVD